GQHGQRRRRRQRGVRQQRHRLPAVCPEDAQPRLHHRRDQGDVRRHAGRIRQTKRGASGWARLFSVSKNDTLQGEPISARIRGTEIPSPWWLRFPAFAAPVAAGLQKADRCPCSASAVSSAGRASASQSLGTKLSAEPRTRPCGVAHSACRLRTLSAPNFPVCVPSICTCRLDGTFLTVCSVSLLRHAASCKARHKKKRVHLKILKRCPALSKRRICCPASQKRPRRDPVSRAPPWLHRPVLLA